MSNSPQNSELNKINRFVVLDRDGTIIEERNYLSDPNKIKLLSGVPGALRNLRQAGFGLVVITNQSGIGRGYFTESKLHEINNKMAKLLENENVVFEGIYFCPHLPTDFCKCRKPQTALLEKAASDHNFDFQNCFVIGDKPSDIELGRRMGAATILVRTGYGDQVAKEGTANPSYTADNLIEAARYILNQSEEELPKRVV